MRFVSVKKKRLDTANMKRQTFLSHRMLTESTASGQNGMLSQEFWVLWPATSYNTSQTEKTMRLILKCFKTEVLKYNKIF